MANYGWNCVIPTVSIAFLPPKTLCLEKQELQATLPQKLLPIFYLVPRPRWLRPRKEKFLGDARRAIFPAGHRQTGRFVNER
jgi:hypothetical protein